MLNIAWIVLDVQRHRRHDVRLKRDCVGCWLKHRYGTVILFGASASIQCKHRLDGTRTGIRFWLKLSRGFQNMPAADAVKGFLLLSADRLFERKVLVARFTTRFPTCL